jgi:hypothetical protein
MHILRQYIGWVKRTLVMHKLPLAVAVASDVGYALCEIASPPRMRR